MYHCIRISPTVIGEECNENISLDICTYVLDSTVVLRYNCKKSPATLLINFLFETSVV